MNTHKVVAVCKATLFLLITMWVVAITVIVAIKFIQDVIALKP